MLLIYSSNCFCTYGFTLNDIHCTSVMIIQKMQVIQHISEQLALNTILDEVILNEPNCGV